MGTFRFTQRVVNLTAGPLVAKFVKRGKSNMATLTITNHSNVPFLGTVPVTTELFSSGTSLSQTTMSKKLSITVGRAVKVSVSFWGPETSMGYLLRSRVDPGNVFSQINVADDVAELSLVSALH